MFKHNSIKILAYFAHPLHLVIWVFFIFIAQNKLDVHTCKVDKLKEIFISTCLNVVLFPLLLVILAYRLQLVTSISLKEKKDRIIPLFGLMTFVFWAWRVAKEHECLHPLLKHFLFGIFLATILMVILNHFIFFSIFAVGGATIFYFFIAMSIVSQQVNVLLLTIIFLFLSLQTKYVLQQHKKNEIVVGFLIGFFSQALSFINF